jgi:hypothetical protein
MKWRVDTVTLSGDTWRRVAEAPRLIVESWRRLLDRYGVPNMVRTPFQWVVSSPVIEIETGGYMGMVQLYVPEMMLETALEVLEHVGALTPLEDGGLDEHDEIDGLEPGTTYKGRPE